MSSFINNEIQGVSLTGNTIYSGNTELSLLFVTTNQFSIANSNITLLQNQMLTKVNLSGDTMTGQLNAPSISATTLSANTLVTNYPIPGTFVRNFMVWEQNGLSGVTLYNVAINNNNYSKFGLVAGSTNALYSTSDFSVILNGQRHYTYYNSKCSLLLNGYNNKIFSSNYSIIGNGYRNRIYTSSYGTILNGKESKVVTSTFSLILNGLGNNTSASTMSTVLNGFSNAINNSVYSLSNGYINSISNSSFSVMLSGSRNNINIGSRNLILNGSYNTLSSYYCSIINGMYNTISNSHSFISSGVRNSVSGIYSSIIGGSGNTISGNHSSIIGGQSLSLSLDNTVMVPDLVIANLASNTGSYMLVSNVSGKVFKTVLPSSSGSGGSSVNHGINTTTGGTNTFQSVNVTALTINTLVASGATTLNTLFASILSASTIMSGSTNLYDIFVVNNSNVVTQSQLNTKVNKSGDTMSGGLTSPYFSASTITATTATTTYLKINTNSGSTSNPERVIIYDGETNSFSNILKGLASASTYAQINIQNLSAGANSSSDIVATANNGDENTNFIDMGINSSSFTGNVGLANDAYIYSTGNDMFVGNSTQNKKVGIFIGQSSATTVDFTSGKTTFNKPIYSGSSELTQILALKSQLPYDISTFRVSGSTLDRWYGNNIAGFAFSTSVITGNRLYLIPFIITKSMVIDRIAIAATAGTGVGGDTARLGIYSASGSNNYFPTTLLGDYGTVPVSGISTNLSIAISQYLDAGLYYAAFNTTAGPTLRAVPSTALPNFYGSTSNLSTAIGTFLTINLTYGSLPTDLTSSASTLTFNATVCPYVAYRVTIN